MSYEFFTGASCSLLLLAAARIGISRNRHSGSTWLLVLVCGAMFYLLRPLLNVTHPALDLLLALPVMVTPAAFWLFTHALCSESQDFPHWGWWLIAADITIDLASHLNLHPAFYVLAQPLKLVLIGAGLSTLLQQLHSDLVAERRQLRIALLIAIGGYMLIVVFAEFAFSYHKVPRGVPMLHVVLVSMLTFAASLWLLALSPRALEESLPPTGEAAAETAQETEEPAKLDQPQRLLLEKLQAHMNNGGYRHTGLTIRELAAQLDAREHVLRVLINRHLGYRNFNEYLNQFRIDEASRRLADPDEAHLPILTIVLDIGYRSLSPFNAAFKRRHECTPTEYRRERLPE
ncbi:helix-turn-helix transcriptional regulator [Microbulbifer sp. SA54]|uniref:helix-turn-helix transcriptional regulator n=1 Tax=Microbulbifer sp. SA54 TaxID=3401577 RepID=UPI003AAB94CF